MAARERHHKCGFRRGDKSAMLHRTPMQDAVPRTVRAAERFLLAPPLAGRFGAAAVSLCDISVKGARFRHTQPLEMGTKSLLRLPVDGRQVSFEAVVVWTQAESSGFTSGVRTYGAAEVIEPLLADLQAPNRSRRWWCGRRRRAPASRR